MSNLQRHDRDMNLRAVSPTRLTPAGMRAARQMTENAELARYEIALRRRLSSGADEELAGVYADSFRVFSENREAFEDIVEHTRDGDCYRDTAAFVQGMLPEFAADLRSNVLDATAGIRAAANRSLEPDTRRSFWQRVRGE